MSAVVDASRRKFLTTATSVVGGIGAAFAAIPFAGSWSPSAKAQALGAPVEVDVSKIAPGQKITLSWRGQPVFVVHRTDDNLQQLAKLTSQLRDPLSNKSIQPSYITTESRAIKDQYLVVVAICTHLGCVPVYKPKLGSLDAAWLGGFFCPCHGSKYDLSGRVYTGVPAPTNLTIPPYRYVNDSLLIIGEDRA